MADATPKHLTLKYLPLAWCGLALAIVVLTPLTIEGDIHSALGAWGISFDTLAMMLHEVGLLAGTAITLRLLSRRGVRASDLGVGGTIKASWIAYAIGGFILAVFLYPAVGALAQAVGLSMFWWGDGRFEYRSPLDWCLAVIAAILMAPVIEELFFRGYLLTALLGRVGSAPTAVCLASLVFMSIHVLMGPGILIYVFLWSLIPSYLYLRTGSLYPAMLMHALNNIFAYVVLPALL